MRFGVDCCNFLDDSACFRSFLCTEYASASPRETRSATRVIPRSDPAGFAKEPDYLRPFFEFRVFLLACKRWSKKLHAAPSKIVGECPTGCPCPCQFSKRQGVYFERESVRGEIALTMCRCDLGGNTYTTRAISSNMKSKSTTVHSLATNHLLQF